jgi:hypothetical protein
MIFIAEPRAYTPEAIKAYRDEFAEANEDTEEVRWVLAALDRDIKAAAELRVKFAELGLLHR